MINEQPSYRPQHVCPCWLCFTFDNIFRKLFQNPERILKPYIIKGSTVLDIGPGIGYFTIPLAKLVGETGKVVAADIQQNMLDGIRHRAIRAGVIDVIKLHRSMPDKIGINEDIDFCLAFWMVHEVNNRTRFFGEIVSRLKKDGLLLLAEPKLHVSVNDFSKTLDIVESVGLSIIDKPKISLSQSALLKK
jgi:ubiquinone/menaquinone biosynthesis C-methylase UbiE